jgi:hypothetical protein
MRTIPKLVLSVLATIVLLLHMSTVTFLAGAAAGAGGVDSGGLWSELLHAGGGILVLLVVTTLGVYKPRGLTPYGRRVRHEPSEPPPDDESTSTHGHGR